MTDRLLLLAAGLTLLLSVAHSLVGERLVFARLRKDGRWTEAALSLLERRRWWAFRATWHLVTILGAGLAALLFSDALGSIGFRWRSVSFSSPQPYSGRSRHASAIRHGL